jgi:hypothetical protein
MRRWVYAWIFGAELTSALSCNGAQLKWRWVVGAELSGAHLIGHPHRQWFFLSPAYVHEKYIIFHGILYNEHRDARIDYKCDVEKKTKNFQVGAPSWYHCVAEDFRIPKMPVINPLQALVNPQTQKKKKDPAWIVNPQPQLLRICFFDN